MHIKTGVDVVYIPRFTEFLDNPGAVKQTFSSRELERDTPEHLAGVFAIKEAFFKALGKNPKFLDIEVSPERGKPQVNYPSSYGISSFDASVSHEKDYCVASVVMIMKNRSNGESDLNE